MTMIAQPKTIEKAIHAATYRQGFSEPDYSRIEILKRVLATGEACMKTINKYKTI